MNRNRLAIAGLVACAFAAVALGQNADKNTSGPTKNDYKLRVVEPAEGATITGPSVRVVVNNAVREQLDDGKKDVNSMPRADIDVFIDDTLQGTMRDQNNVLQIDAVAVGAHKLVVVAKNRSNEIIDRKEIHFSSVSGEGTAATTGPADATRSARVEPPPPPPAPRPAAPPAPAPPPASSYAPPPPPPASTSSQYSSTTTTEESKTRHMPATASLDPALAIAGGSLVLASLVIRRLLARRRRRLA